MKTIKNYTSSVPAITSMGRIEQCLVEAGATDISKSYGHDKICSAIRFRMMIKDTPVFFQLPANVDACFKVLWGEIKRPKPETKNNVMQQAERTAWKIVSDWVEIQLSMIKLEQAKALQVFLPYVYHPESNTTLFERIENNPRLLNSGT